MSSKENLVKHPEAETEEVEEIEEDDDIVIDIDDDDDDPKSVSSSSAAKNKMFKFMGIILAITILLLIILFVISSLKPKVYEFDDIEKILKDAAVSYFKDFPESLPQNEGSIIEIDSSNLVAAGKMKELSEYTQEGVVCSGTVQVEKTGTDYLYTPYLNCGENYATVELYKKITEGDIVTTGYGLYASGGSYVYKGEDVNNYLKLGKNTWRIVKINSDNSMVLISNELVGYGALWDDRYNETKSFEAGINQYSVSRMHEYLDNIYTKPSEKEEDKEMILSSADKTKLIPFNLCVGKRSQGSEGKDGAIECEQKLKNQKIGLLTVAEYMNASLDPNCKNSVSKTCKNYNYLSKITNWWLVTGDKDDSSQVYVVNQTGKVAVSLGSNFYGVRPVVYLNSKALYRGGNGTLEKPYLVK